MYHHRYQPPPHLANKTVPAYANNFTINSYPSSSSSSNLTSNSNLNNNNSTSYSGLPHYIIEERQDVIFRKVRGILNKITPETFDKLSKELVNVGLDSPRTLRGVIYLLFDKALKDLKYSSLYAKLCQELSEKAPNFEQESGPNTFCKFLISKCEDEFERRRKATEDFDSKNELTDEEYEQKAIAKQKMLGNIKFICELGKKRLLQEEILHECIRGLLSKKKERPVQDQAQDLECLCQIMRTIGSLLDVQASRNLMNQYFERIDLFSKKPELPSRIRFMLRDVIDLRNNNWRPRPFQREDNVPQPLSKLREEAGYDQGNSSSMDKFGNSRSLIGISDLSKLHGNKLSLLLDDEPSFTTSTDFHWGPAFLPHDHFDAFSSNSTNPNQIKSSSATTVSNANQNPTAPVSFQKGPIFKIAGPTKEQDKRKQEHPLINSSPSQHPNEVVKKVSQSFGFERRSFSDTNTTLHDVREPPTDQRMKASAVVNPPKMQARDEKVYNTPRRFIENRHAPPFQLPPAAPHTGPIPPRRELNQPPILNNPQIPQQPYDQRSQQRIEPIDRRDRRFIRPDFPNNDHRPSRFNSNLNYRPSRYDRAQPHREHHYLEKSNLSESDMNFNWRSAPSRSNPPPTKPPVMSETTPVPPQVPVAPVLINQKPLSERTSNQIESRIAVECPVKPTIPATSVPKVVERGRTFDVMLPEKRPVIEKSAPVNWMARDSTTVYPKDNQSAGLNYYGSQRSEQVSNVPAYVDVRQPILERRVHTSPSRQTPRRPQVEQNLQNSQPPQPTNSNRNYRFQNRNVFPDQVEKKEIRKFQPDGRHNIENQHNSRTNEASSSQERNFRPQTTQINRNSHVENNTSSKQDKVPIWKRGITAQINNQPPKEGPASSFPSPLLPRPLSKPSDTNFSLRPSHNLAGRASSNVNNNISSNIITKTGNTSTDEATRKTEGLDLQRSGKNNEIINSKPTSNANLTPQNSSPFPNVPSSSTEETKSDPLNTSPTRSAARELNVKKFMSILSVSPNESSTNLNRIIAKIKELKIPKTYQQDCLFNSMRQSISQTENDRDTVSKLFVQLVPQVFDSSSLLNAFKILFEQLQSLEVETPKVKSILAGFLSQAVLDGLISLEEVGSVLSGGKHHPLFLLFLQKLEKSGGQAWLNEKFILSKINLINMLPEVDRSKDRLASILKDRCLGFLDPMLTIEPDLSEQMKEKDPSPAAIYRWIKDNVDPIIQGSPSFAHVLISCLMKYIHGVATEKSKAVTVDESESGPHSNKSSPSSSSQSTGDVEKELLTRYQQVLQALLKDKQMQLATLYALQLFYYGLDFPKGSLLRWFHMLWDMNIVDDDVFFTWKEEINDGFPGKGQALFQVNTWLNWLAEVDSEEEEEV